MHDNPIPGQTNDVHDRAAEAATLDRMLWLRPTHLTEAELLLNLFAEDGPRRDVPADPLDQVLRITPELGGPPSAQESNGSIRVAYRAPGSFVIVRPR